VVAANEAGFRETTLDGETGFLVDRDEGAMSSAIDMLLGNEALQRALGRNGLERVRHFGLDSFWSQVERQLQCVARDNRLDRTWTDSDPTLQSRSNRS